MIDHRIGVFVSSTMDELAAERNAIRSVLSKNPSLALVMFEDFGARPEGVREAYLSEIMKSKIVIGILWKELSPAVEEELVQALRLSKDLLIFVKNHASPADSDLLVDRLKISGTVTFARFIDSTDLESMAERSIGNLLAERFSPRDTLKMLDMPRLLGTCREQAKGSISGISGERVKDSNRKYVSDLYTTRKRIENEVARFIEDAEYSAMTVVGQAGVGKTNLACHVAENSLGAGTPTMFFNAAFVSSHLEQVVMDALQPCVPRSTSFHEFQNRLEDILGASDSHLVIVLDAINEAPNPASFKADLTNFVSRLSNKVKLLATCRDIDWAYFTEGNEPLKQRLYGQASEENTATMGNFTEDEFKDAWKAYQSAFGFKGQPSIQIADICRHPLLLRFLAEGFEGDTVPQDIRHRQIFDRYWERKLAQTRMADIAMDRLFKIVALMIAKGKSELPLTQIVAYLDESSQKPESPLQRILSEGLIIYVRLDPFYDRMVGFSYEAFFEYVIARYYWHVQWVDQSDSERAKRFKDLIETAKKSRPLRGALAFLILFAEEPDETLHLDMIASLRGTRSDLEIVGCSAIPKLNDLTSNVLEAIKALAESEFVESALFAREVFAQVHYRVENLEEVLQDWAFDQREFVRAVVGATISRLERARLSYLLELAEVMLTDPAYWVRLHVINSIADLADNNESALLEAFETWSARHEPKVDQGILRAIGHIHTPILAPAYFTIVEEIYKYYKPKMDCDVALALGVVGHIDVQKALSIVDNILDTEDPIVIYEAVNSLKSFGHKDYIYALKILAKAKSKSQNVPYGPFRWRLPQRISAAEHAIDYQKRYG